MTLLSTLVDASRRVGATSSRLGKIRELSEALRALDHAEINVAVLYLSGELPQGKIGVQYSTLQAAADVEPAQRATLSILDLHTRLDELAELKGAGSSRKRTLKLSELIALSTTEERDFIFRLLTGELRQGALAGIMLEAIAAAAKLPIAQVRRAAMYADNLGALARAAMLEGTEGLAKFQLQLLFPIAPMLAQTATDVADALEQLGGQVELEWKMDGARIQVHKSDDVVHVFTRSANDVTIAVPEIVEAVRDFHARTLIRWRSHCDDTLRPTAYVPNDDAALRSQARRGSDADRAADSGLLLRLFVHR
jgi:DNA ligase-1